MSVYTLATAALYGLLGFLLTVVGVGVVEHTVNFIAIILVVTLINITSYLRGRE